MKFTIKGKDIIAAIMLIGAFTLRGLGINHVTEYIIIGIAIVYGLVAIPKPKIKKK